MRPLTDLFGASQFSTGLMVGIVALVVTFPTALGLSALFPRRGRRPGLVGPVFALATVFALDGTLGTDVIFSVPDDVLIALGLLWVAGTIAALTPVAWLVGPLAAIPGAVMLADANAGLADGWVPVAMVIGTVLIGATAADFDRRTARFGLGPLLLFTAVAGIYVTVPDTELMRAVMGVGLALVFLAWPYAAAALGGGGAYAAVGILLWITPIDGIGRSGSIIGAIGAFALLFGEPIGRVIARELESRARLARHPIKRPRAMVVGAQLVLVFYATRIAGQAQTASGALLLMIPGIVASIACGVFFVIPERRRHRLPSARSSRRSTEPVATSPPRGNGGRGKRRLHGHGSHDDYV